MAYRRECVFCRIVRGEAPSYIVYRDDTVVVFLDIYPVEKGHILVTPIEHYESLIETPPNIALHVLATASAIANI